METRYKINKQKYTKGDIAMLMLRPYFVIVKYLNVNVIYSFLNLHSNQKKKENLKNFKGLIVDVLI